MNCIGDCLIAIGIMCIVFGIVGLVAMWLHDHI
jgi:hypothetical protein